jgi:uncharacterized protein YukE
MHLRARAEALDEIARRLDALDVDVLVLFADHDTWRGPTARTSQDDLRRAAMATRAAVGALRMAACALRRQADEAAVRAMVAGRS